MRSDDDKDDALWEAKKVAIMDVVDGVIHRSHVGHDNQCQPNKIAVDAFGAILAHGDYAYTAMAFDQKGDLNGDLIPGGGMFQYRNYLEAREEDWKAAIANQRPFNDFSNLVINH